MTWRRPPVSTSGRQSGDNRRPGDRQDRTPPSGLREDRRFAARAVHHRRGCGDHHGRRRHHPPGNSLGLGSSPAEGGAGDPSPVTSRACSPRPGPSPTSWGDSDLAGRRFAVQGVGKVGAAFVQLLVEACRGHRGRLERERSRMRWRPMGSRGSMWRTSTRSIAISIRLAPWEAGSTRPRSPVSTARRSLAAPTTSSPPKTTPIASQPGNRLRPGFRGQCRRLDQRPRRIARLFEDAGDASSRFHLRRRPKPSSSHRGNSRSTRTRRRSCSPRTGSGRSATSAASAAAERTSIDQPSHLRHGFRPEPPSR